VDDAGGMDGLYIGYSEDMAREYIDDCAMWARAFARRRRGARDGVPRHRRAGRDAEIKAFRIDFASGFKILALSSRPRIAARQAGRRDDRRGGVPRRSRGLLKAALAMMIWGGRVRILSSHNGEDNPFNLLCKDIEAGKLPYSLHTTDFAQALDAGLFERVKLVMGKRLKEKTREEWEAKVRAQYGEGAAEELDCIPSMGGGVYIPRPVVERCQRGPELCRSSPGRSRRSGCSTSGASRETDDWIRDVLKPASTRSTRSTART
jgi:phage FluMu gp28-like protein